MIWIFSRDVFSLTVNEKSSPALPNTCICDKHQGIPETIKKVEDSVVNIKSITVVQQKITGFDYWDFFLGTPFQKLEQTALGSGFLIDTQGFIITNAHVIQGATEVVATLKDKRVFRARLIGKDEKEDIALLQLKQEQNTPPLFKPAVFGNSDNVQVGETVIAIGNSFGFDNSVSTGIIGAKNRTIGMGPYDNFFQITAAINPGNSGGPLFNLDGQLIGINTAIYSNTGQNAGIGFAIPVNELKEILPFLQRYGRVPRPWLGILGQSYVDDTYRGVIVVALVPRAPAAISGKIQAYDLIQKVEEQPVSSILEIEKALKKVKPLEMVTLQILRNGKTLNVKIKTTDPKNGELLKGTF